MDRVGREFIGSVENPFSNYRGASTADSDQEFARQPPDSEKKQNSKERSEVSVLLNNGSGTFSTVANYSAGIGPFAVAVSDFDGDNHADLAVANYDSDGDGVPDDVDNCPNSNLSPTVVIDGCDSGVPNTLLARGCTISDLIAQCAAGASNHGQFVNCVAHLTDSLKKQGSITGAQMAAIQRCAGKARIGK